YTSAFVCTILLTYALFELVLFYFFFQAEDGIRDRNVTGVQTCALPIFIRFTLVFSLLYHGSDDKARFQSLSTAPLHDALTLPAKIGRASCRERVYISMVVTPAIKKLGLCYTKAF